MNNWKMYWSKGAKMTVKKMLDDQKSKEDKKEDTEAKKES